MILGKRKMGDMDESFETMQNSTKKLVVELNKAKKENASPEYLKMLHDLIDLHSTILEDLDYYINKLDEIRQIPDLTKMCEEHTKCIEDMQNLLDLAERSRITFSEIFRLHC